MTENISLITHGFYVPTIANQFSPCCRSALQFSDLILLAANLGVRYSSIPRLGMTKDRWALILRVKKEKSNGLQSPNAHCIFFVSLQYQEKVKQ
jgi:hypothetical protein